jgi:hypothetical protein
MIEWSDHLIKWSVLIGWSWGPRSPTSLRLARNQTSLIFSQAIASSEYCRRKVILIANLLQRHRSTWTPACLRSIGD